MPFPTRGLNPGKQKRDREVKQDASHIGHFYWTNSTDYNSGTATYMPYASTYSFSSQNPSDKFWCGEENKLSVDGVNGLFVLSSGEWDYLLAHGTCKRGVTVGDKENCLVIAPDGFTGEIKTSYTLDELNAAGLVCLPAAGCYDEQIDRQDVDGFYWSSTSVSKSSAYIPSFNTSDLMSPSTYRGRGCSIRAVVAE